MRRGPDWPRVASDSDTEPGVCYACRSNRCKTMGDCYNENLRSLSMSLEFTPICSDLLHIITSHQFCVYTNYHL